MIFFKYMAIILLSRLIAYLPQKRGALFLIYQKLTILNVTWQRLVFLFRQETTYP